MKILFVLAFGFALGAISMRMHMGRHNESLTACQESLASVSQQADGFAKLIAVYRHKLGLQPGDFGLQ